MKTKDMVLIPLFAVIMAICAWITIPGPVPFTMQTFGIFFSLTILGGRKGTWVMVLYLIMGMVGIPVFSSGMAGIGVLMGSTGGYLIGWVFSALFVWALEKAVEGKDKLQFLSMLLGHIICYVFGTIWFMVVYTRTKGEIGVWAALSACVIPFILPDILKIWLAFTTGKRLKKVVSKM